MLKLTKKLTIVDFATKGFLVGKTEEGLVVFLKDVVPDDVVNAFIYKKRKGVFYGKVTDFISYSKNRVEPVCSHFGDCGGCKWLHISYDTQLKFKEKKVRDDIEKLAKIEEMKYFPIIGSKETSYYRNKVEFSFSNNRWFTQKEIESDKKLTKNGLGFHKSGMWDKVVDIEKCYLQKDPSNSIRNEIRKYAIDNNLDFYDLKNQTGFLRNIMIRTSTTNEIMVLIQFYEERGKERIALLEFLITKFPSITSLVYVINNKGNDSIYDQEISTYHGNKYIYDTLLHLKFKINAKSFFQINATQTIELYNTITKFGDFSKDEVVYDLYTGIGSIALFIADKVKKVIGIETVKEAIENANENKEINNIKNASFFCGDVKDVLFKSSFNEEKPDTIIIDPPREGIHKKVVQKIIEISPNKIIYISCNPTTQARDIFLLKEKYKCLYNQTIDMFPNTEHIENVILLQKI